VQANIPPWLATLDATTARVQERRYGSGYLARLKADRRKLEAEAIQLFHELAEKYGDQKHRGKTLGEYARAAIFEIQGLGVGKPAPDIEGEDIEGRRLKLSDYRGKVVVLDFWGHW
jgi:hypothetical protein